MTTHYLGIKSTDKPEIAGAEFTEDVEFSGKYGLELQNINDILSNKSYWFDKSNDSVTITHNANLDVGVNDFSLEILFKPDSITAANQFLVNKEAGGIGYGLEQRLNDLWIRFDDGITDVSAIIGTDVFSINTNYYLIVTFDRSGNATAYINGKSVGTVAISTASLTLDNAGAFTIGTETGGTTKPFGGRNLKVRLHNKLYTAAEVKSLYSGSSIPYKYIGGGNKYTSDFSAGVDGWGTTSQLTLTGNVDSIGGQDNNLQFRATGNGVHYGRKNFSLRNDKRYRVSFNYYCPSTNIKADSLFFYSYDYGVQLGNTGAMVTDTWTSYSVEFEGATSGTGVSYYVGDIGGGGTGWDATGSTDDIYIRNVTITQIGCVLNLNPSGIGYNQWIDQSGNNLHGTVSDAIPTNLPTDHVEKYINMSMSADSTFTLPAGYKIKAITVKETAGNAITGGLNIGSSAGGAQVVSAEAIGASSTVNCTLLQTFFSTDSDQTIYVSDVTSWNSASIDLYCWMDRIIA